MYKYTACAGPLGLYPHVKESAVVALRVTLLLLAASHTALSSFYVAFIGTKAIYSSIFDSQSRQLGVLELEFSFFIEHSYFSSKLQSINLQFRFIAIYV